MVATTVRDVMLPEPWTVDAESTLEETARLMRAWDVREVLVTSDGELCGVLTDSDIIVLAIASGRDPATLSAGECRFPAEHWVEADQPVDVALDYMRSHALRRLPVVEGNQLIGTAWIADLGHALADH